MLFKCIQMVQNAQKFPCLYDTIWDFSQILQNAPRVFSNTPPNATKCSQMRPCLYDTVWDFASKCIQMLTNINKRTRILQIPTCYQTLPNAPRFSQVFHAFMIPYSILRPSAPSPHPRTLRMGSSLKLASTKLQQKTFNKHKTHQHKCSSQVLPNTFREHFSYTNT